MACGGQDWTGGEQHQLSDPIESTRRARPLSSYCSPSALPIPRTHTYLFLSSLSSPPHSPPLSLHPPTPPLHTPRYLVYDIMSVNGTAVVHEPFLRRYGRIEDEVVRPRQAEAAYIQEGEGSRKYRAPPLA